MNIYDLTTPGDIISYGVVVTIQGILVVFLILILIMLVIYAMGALSSEKKTKKMPAKEEAVVQTAPVVEEAVSDEGELIAVLTAAVAACMGTSSASVSIRSYKKVSSAWGNAAKREVLEKC